LVCTVTKPRSEDLVASRLQDIGIEILNPKLKSKKYQGNKIGEVIEPLFPCYLFANFEKEKYSHLLKTSTAFLKERLKVMKG